MRLNIFAVIGSKSESGSWTSKVASTSHNGENKDAAAQVIAAHPGEHECMLDNRVIGAIAVTRGMCMFMC